MFDKNGNIIGVVQAKHTQAENAGYAIKSSYIRNLVELLPTSINLPVRNLLAGKSLSQQVSLASKAVCIVIINDDRDEAISSNTHLNDIIVNYPKVARNTLEDEENYTLTRISKISITNNYTIVELSLKNYLWCNINPHTYIIANGNKYEMIKAEGIAISPQKTTPSYRGADINCKLFFPPIPRHTNSIDLIESLDSRWKFYGVQLR